MKILNIGLEKSPLFNEEGQLKINEVLETLKKFNLVGSYKVAQSTTEPTLIYYTFKNIDEETLKKISDTLHQECIAVYDTKAKKGELIGEYAESWGDFKDEYFIK